MPLLAPVTTADCPFNRMLPPSIEPNDPRLPASAIADRRTSAERRMFRRCLPPILIPDESAKLSAAHGPRWRHEPDPPSMPTGTVTFLLTDVEDRHEHGAPTRRHGPPPSFATISSSKKPSPRTAATGPSIKARRFHRRAFARPSAAVAAAVNASALVAELSDRFTVRMALHTGEAMDHDGNYFGRRSSDGACDPAPTAVRSWCHERRPRWWPTASPTRSR
jgi:hypothetical protein